MQNNGEVVSEDEETGVTSKPASTAASRVCRFRRREEWTEIVLASGVWGKADGNR